MLWDGAPFLEKITIQPCPTTHECWRGIGQPGYPKTTRTSTALESPTIACRDRWIPNINESSALIISPSKTESLVWLLEGAR